MSIVAASEHDVVVEATVVHYDADAAHADNLDLVEILNPVGSKASTGTFGVVKDHLRTGIRLKFGFCW